MRTSKGETSDQILERADRIKAAKDKITAGTEQLDLDDVKVSSPQDVAAALDAGQLRDLGYAAPRKRRGH